MRAAAQWNGGTADRRAGSISSDVSSAQPEPAAKPARRKRTTSRDSQHSIRVLTALLQADSTAWADTVTPFSTTSI